MKAESYLSWTRDTCIVVVKERELRGKRVDCRDGGLVEARHHFGSKAKTLRILHEPVHGRDGRHLGRVLLSAHLLCGPRDRVIWVFTYMSIRPTIEREIESVRW